MKIWVLVFICLLFGGIYEISREANMAVRLKKLETPLSSLQQSEKISNSPSDWILEKSDSTIILYDNKTKKITYYYRKR